MNKHLTVGLDCGAHTGIAIYDSLQKKITETKTTDFFGAISYLKTLPKDDIKIIVEVPSDFIYARNDFQKGAVRDKMAINIGANRFQDKPVNNLWQARAGWSLGGQAGGKKGLQKESLVLYIFESSLVVDGVRENLNNFI